LKFALIEERIVAVEERIVAIEERIKAMEKNIEIMKVDISFIKNSLKKKVDVEEFETLERRVAILEAKLAKLKR